MRRAQSWPPEPTGAAWKSCLWSCSCFALRSLRQPVLERERQEDGYADLRLNGVGEARFLFVPPALRGRVSLDRQVLELVREDVVPHFEVRREPAIEEDAEADAGVEGNLRVE